MRVAPGGLSPPEFWQLTMPASRLQTTSGQFWTDLAHRLRHLSPASPGCWEKDAPNARGLAMEICG